MGQRRRTRFKSAMRLVTVYEWLVVLLCFSIQWVIEKVITVKYFPLGNEKMSWARFNFVHVL
jgi:hypothetical protein